MALPESAPKPTHLASYRKAIELEPEYAKAHFNLGLAFQQKGDHEAAQREFAEAQHLDPNLKPPPEPEKK